jgi:tetratricopeptide (TPR) repeat protein
MSLESLETALREAEIALATSPEAVAPLFARAHALDGLGRNEAAAQAYLDVLRVAPMHFEALTALGTLAIKTGQGRVARAAFVQAAQACPHRATGHANAGIVLSDQGEFDAAREHFETALRLEPDNRTAHRGLAILLLRLGETEAAERHGRTGFRGKADEWPYRGAGRPVSLLLVLSAVGPNAPIESFMDDRIFRKWTLSPEFFDPSADLPPHDVAFHALGDADRCGPALDTAAAILSRTKARVLNPPPRVRETGRAANSERLARLAGIVTPRTAEWTRDSLMAQDAPAALARAGFAWPLLLRSPGYHAGVFFVKVDGPHDLALAVAGLPGETLFVIQFVDTRGADGKFRKCRVMMVDGRLYPLHLAVSANWKVHYFSADMADSAEHRAQDEAFLQDMPRALGAGAMRALEQIRDLVALDYGGIDFALDREGNVVVFETNAAMAVVPPSGGEQWKYRHAPVQRVRQAVTRMLLEAAGRPAGGTE